MEYAQCDAHCLACLLFDVICVVLLGLLVLPILFLLLLFLLLVFPVLICELLVQEGVGSLVLGHLVMLTDTAPGGVQLIDLLWRREGKDNNVFGMIKIYCDLRKLTR